MVNFEFFLWCAAVAAAAIARPWNAGRSLIVFLIWKFMPDGQAVLTPLSELPSITVEITNPIDPTQTVAIPLKCVTSANRTLGVHKAGDLSNDHEYAYKQTNKLEI